MSERSRWKETITIWTTVHSAHAGQAAILKGITAARNPAIRLIQFNTSPNTNTVRHNTVTSLKPALHLFKGSMAWRNK